jgi:hypothetical protein
MSRARKPNEAIAVIDAEIRAAAREFAEAQAKAVEAERILRALTRIRDRIGVASPEPSETPKRAARNSVKAAVVEMCGGAGMPVAHVAQMTTSQRAAFRALQKAGKIHETPAETWVMKTDEMKAAE